MEIARESMWIKIKLFFWVFNSKERNISCILLINRNRKILKAFISRGEKIMKRFKTNVTSIFSNHEWLLQILGNKETHVIH